MAAALAPTSLPFNHSNPVTAATLATPHSASLRAAAQQSGSPCLLNAVATGSTNIATGISPGLVSPTTQGALGALLQTVDDTLVLLKSAGLPVGQSLPNLPAVLRSAQELSRFRDMVEQHGLQGLVQAVDRSDVVNGMHDLRVGLQTFSSSMGMQGAVTSKMLGVCDEVTMLADHTLAYLQCPSSGSATDQLRSAYHLCCAGIALEKVKRDLGQLL